MSHATLIVCAAVVIWSAGCAPTYEQRHAAIQAEYDQEMAKIHAKYDAMARKNRQESADWYQASYIAGDRKLGIRTKRDLLQTVKNQHHQNRDGDS